MESISVFSQQSSPLTNANPRPAKDWSPVQKRIGWVVVLFGALIRLRNYLHAPSLFEDEASIALNLISRSYHQLLGPLDYNQGAPIGFLWVMKTVIGLLDTSEAAVRLVPFLAGAGVLVLSVPVARQILPARTGLLFLAMLGVSPTLIWYADQTKQYSIDTLTGVVLLVPAIAFWQASQSAAATRSTVFEAVVWALVVAGSVWFSHPAVFTIAGTVLTVMASSSVAGRRRDAMLAGVVGFVGAISFGINYLLFDRHLVENSYLQRYWSAGFMPVDTVRHRLVWIAMSIGEACRLPLGDGAVASVAVAAALGGIALARSRRLPLVGLALGPLIVCYLAAIVHRYPFQHRLLSFSVPGVLLVCAIGVDWLWLTMSRRWRWSAPILAITLLAVPGVRAAMMLVHPLEFQQHRLALSYIARHRGVGEPVCVINDAMTPYLFYQQQCGVGPGTFLDARNFHDANGATRPFHGRTWVYFINYGHGIAYMDKGMLAEFKLHGRLLDSFESYGVQALEFDLP